MKDAAGYVAAAAGDGQLDRGDDEPGLHSRVDRVADDPVGEQVLDGAAVELAFVGPVLGEVRYPHHVGGGGGEVPADEVVVGRGAGFGALVALGLAEPFHTLLSEDLRHAAAHKNHDQLNQAIEAATASRDDIYPDDPNDPESSTGPSPTCARSGV